MRSASAQVSSRRHACSRKDEATDLAVVLDTHALVWLLEGDDRLGPGSRKMIAAASNSRGALVAAISTWEIAMLVVKGRLALDRDVGEWLDKAFALPGLRLAPSDAQVAVDSTRLPGELHGDPSDRLIVATARRHSARLVTEDGLILAYGRKGHVKTQRAGA